MRSVTMAGRAFMARSLSPVPARVRAPAGCLVRTFDATRLDEMASVQHAAYQRTPDARVFPDLLGTVGACRAHLASLIEQRGPYRFAPECSVLLVEDGVVRGFCMASLGPHGSASIDNVAVEPGRRGGAGRALLVESMRQLASAGAQSVSLTVTCANVVAMDLYHRCGFIECVRLPVPLGAPNRR